MCVRTCQLGNCYNPHRPPSPTITTKIVQQAFLIYPKIDYAVHKAPNKTSSSTISRFSFILLDLKKSALVAFINTTPHSNTHTHTRIWTSVNGGEKSRARERSFLWEWETERVSIKACAVLDNVNVNGWGQLGGAVAVAFVVVNCFLFVSYARGKSLLRPTTPLPLPQRSLKKYIQKKYWQLTLKRTRTSPSPSPFI